MFDRFNDRSSDLRVFLLCAKAGGTGLNLTGDISLSEIAKRS